MGYCKYYTRRHGCLNIKLSEEQPLFLDEGMLSPSDIIRDLHNRKRQ